MTEPTDPAPESPLKFSELLSLSMQLNSRIDTLWQRVIYSHGVMVGVLVFFASAQHAFVVPRLLVMFFYTLNSIVTFIAFQEAYRGLRAVVSDMCALEGAGGQVHGWAASQSFTQHTRRRAMILGVLWLIIAYLIVYPLLVGSAGGADGLGFLPTLREPS